MLGIIVRRRIIVQMEVRSIRARMGIGEKHNGAYNMEKGDVM